MNDIIEINIGPLSSVNSLHKYLGKKLKELRGAYIAGSSPQVLWDARQLRHGKVSMAGLTAFISVAHSISFFIGKPQKIEFDWKPDLLGFLRDISFIEVSRKLNIFEFESEKMGGLPNEKTNPFTKILYYADVLEEPLKNHELSEYKNYLKTKIRPNFNLRCTEIFKGVNNNKLESIISKTAVELIVNGLIHGKSIVFAGLQRSAKRITVSVCDAGQGFPRSLRNNFEYLGEKELLPHSQALLLGCIIQTKEHGIRLALNEVLDIHSIQYRDILANDGWMIASSYDTEIRWQKYNWHKALCNIDNDNILQSADNIEDLLGVPIEYHIDQNHRNTGYWQLFPNYIKGSRFIFEIPIKN